MAASTGGRIEKFGQSWRTRSGRRSGATMASLATAILLSLCLALVGAQTDLPRGRSSCYDQQGRAQRCMPEFENAAFGKVVDATNTCGLTRETSYCLQTGVTGVRKSCSVCDASRPGLNHPPEYLTDFNNNINWTWWQSETMLEGVQHPTLVNLTLHLKKSYDITYVRIQFHSPRPESFAIYKRSEEDSAWVPFQFYSASCERTYNLRRRGVITVDNEASAICTDEFSDISPLTGGNVAFSTLEGRPSAFEFENSPKLQEWVTATDIKIVLTRMNTFGDEVFRDPQVLKSYFYAISDLAVGARCKCNGHASECVPVRGQDLEDRLECRCEHNTMGTDCDQCLPAFNDRPWARATETDAHECRRCDCNGLSETCYFDAELYRQTGRGGHCTDCRDNAAGPHCEQCLPNHFRSTETSRCTACGCHPTGSQSQQCDGLGRCQCKPGVEGDKCDRCQPNFYDFGIYGCRPCQCSEEGSVDNIARCNSRTGECSCKDHVEGQNCDRCKPGYFGLSGDNPFGCLACFCYGHSSSCTSAPGFFAHNISTDFQTGKQRWTGMDRRNSEVEIAYNGILENVGLKADQSDSLFFVAPARYLGDQRFSYNQDLTFTLRIGEEQPRPSVIDVILEGSEGQRVSTPIFSQGNPMPALQEQTYTFRLHEHRRYQWSPMLTPADFMSILANLTAIKIRGTYSLNGVGYLDNVVLETARQGFTGGVPAGWVEQCQCPQGYVGQFCESCAPGYKRNPPSGGPFATCVPCECNGHSDVCDADTGRCICQDNTQGASCERCASGYYGDATRGTPEDCQPCPCPGQGPCLQLPNQEVVCTQCQEGYGGFRCELCVEGYFGDPQGIYGERKPCQRCFCNDNVDTNAVGICNSTTGECRKCIYNTAGFYCEKCLPNYYGDALALPKGQCRACDCYPNGTIQAGLLTCDPRNGQCPCLPNVQGRRCDQCQSGYWNLDSGKGCEACACDRTGSLNVTCDVRYGQCECKQGVSGRQCNSCQQYHFGFSIAGCQACNCNPEGSLSLQCDEYGHCPCRPNVDGRRCDRCMENKFNLTAGCINCPPCYDLVQDQVNIHRGRLRELNNLIINIGDNPSLFNDSEFISHLARVNKSVNILLSDARAASMGGGTTGQQIQDMRRALNEVVEKTGRIAGSIRAAEDLSQTSRRDIDQAEEAIARAELSLASAEAYLDREGRDALERALQALQRFGRQSDQMTQIAQRTAAESKRQMEEAEQIETLAKNAQQTAKEAYRLAQEALLKPDQTSRDIQRLRQDISDADRLYEQTRLLAGSAQDESAAAHREALNLYSDAQRVAPAINSSALLNQADNIKMQAADIKKTVEDMLERNSDMLSEVEEQKKVAADKRDGIFRLQQRTDELLADVDSARSDARDAATMGEQTLREANETLQTLKGFDELVQASKGRAEEALQRVPDIRATLGEAENTTRQARSALAGAEQDAKEAFRLAKQAQDTAQDASQEASRIRTEAGTTKNKASSLRDDADRLALEAADARDRLQQQEQQAMDDNALAVEALTKAGEAKVKAKEASDKVTQALDTVKDILTILGTLDMPSTERLEQLERELTQVERELEAARIEEQYDRIASANDRIDAVTRSYQDEYSQLKADVDNIFEIKNSLPDGCFLNIEIEPGVQDRR